MGEVKINTKNDIHTRFLRGLRVPAELCVRGYPQSYACGAGTGGEILCAGKLTQCIWKWLEQKINAAEHVAQRCRAAIMPTEMPYWAKNYVTIFVRAAHYLVRVYFHLAKPKFSLKLPRAFEW